MNFLNEIYWNIKFKIEDAIYAIKDKLNNKSYDVEPFVGEEYIEEVEVKPKKKKAKKKSVKKVKKSV
ncbi:MAG: hypothetical protein EBR82_67425 [Caulobacteraceae bacterium]|nr:hypothetical protein [Caulobacteraceae bacterium]